MAETLKRAGIDFTVYEKAGEVGGTWRDNTFKYASASEIWAYIKKVARDCPAAGAPPFPQSEHSAFFENPPAEVSISSPPAVKTNRAGRPPATP